MNIIGQGGKIILFTLPSLIAAILVDLYLSQIAALPERWYPSKDLDKSRT